MSINFIFSLKHFSRRYSTPAMSAKKWKCKIAVCQLTATNNKETNLKVVKELVTEGAQKEAKIIFLPEACDFIATHKQEAKALAEPLTGTLMTIYRNLAKDKNVWLSVGGFHEVTQTKVFNSHVIIDNNGTIQAVYRKLHLFDVSIPEANVHLRESETTEAGSEIIQPVETPAGPLALSICYDLRFPELSLLQRKQGAAILTYPSAFTHATGLLHWETLLKARAIETQCYVIAAAQYGKHDKKRTSYGQALIVDPQGQIVAQCPKYLEGHDSNQSLAFGEVDLELVEKVRREMPVFQHRRDDIYRLELMENPKLPICDDKSFMFSDKIIAGSTVFYRTKYSFAFTNVRCVVPGHVLISSLRCVKRLEDLTPPEVSDFFQTAVKVQKVMESIYSTNATTLCVQDGENAGQTVAHVHVHILPRRANDFPRNDEIYERMAQHDRDSNVPMRSVEEMAEEAKKIRSYFY